MKTETYQIAKIYICPKCKKLRWKTIQGGWQCRGCGYIKWDLRKQNASQK